MKKKPFALLLALFTLFSIFAAFSACDNSPAASGNGTNSLTYDKKYFYYDHRNINSDRYYIFYSNNTGICRAGISFESESSYTIKFNYITMANETVVCFYDSIEYDETYTDFRDVSSVWTTKFCYSPEFMYDLEYNGRCYICETYLNKLPNFGK